MTRECDLDGCQRRHYARGLCQRHYTKQWRRARQASTATSPDRARLVYLRRLVGLPPTGPTSEQADRWEREEARARKETAR